MPEAPEQPRPASEKRYFTPDTSMNEYSAQVAQQPTLTEAIKTIKLEDATKVHLQPCARSSFLAGMGAGCVVGGLRYVFRGGINKACNYAVGTFVGASLVSYEVCQYRRRKEREGMARAVEILEVKRVEREKKIAEMRKQKEEKAAADKAAEEARSRPWYKIW